MKFSVTYDGPAVAEGRMDARKLGRSISSTGVLLERASEISLEGEKVITAQVNADFQRGSFVVDFTAVAEIARQLSHLDQETLRTMVDFIFGDGGALGLAIWLAGRVPDAVERIGDQVHIQVGGESTTVNMTVWSMLTDSDSQDALDGLADPVRSEGVDHMTVQSEGRPLQELDKQAAQHIGKAIDPLEESEEYTAILQVLSPDFRRGNKWEVASEGSTFYASIADEDFLDAVDTHKTTFGKGDALRVQLEVTTKTIDDEVVGREYTVQDVLEVMHVDTPSQDSFL